MIEATADSTRIKELEELLKASEQREDALLNQTYELEDEKREWESTKEDLEDTIKDLKEEVKELEEEKTELEDEKDALETKVSDLEDERDELETKVAILEYDMEQLKTETKPIKPMMVTVNSEADLDSQILHLLKATPGSTVKALAKSLGLDKKVINSKLYKMNNKTVVQMGLDGTAPLWAVK
jgi:chromosome segregation ATPase